MAALSPDLDNRPTTVADLKARLMGPPPSQDEDQEDDDTEHDVFTDR